ncbi:MULTISPECIES: sugar transferase [unclassified Brevundimonas]|uniref:sugar transferase n=1 Tax=unclassified Brevundimonas TaxID=2622653 RepID=UPI00200577F2|nr:MULTISPECIES: sugar transferase [unclassified Brevundimonas]MCK6102830.1 sugar transferase [Brevundimonas sp. EYE_349]
MSSVEAISAPLADGGTGAPAFRWRSASVVRMLDVVLAGGALLLLSPLMVSTALAIWTQCGGPVLFRQQRIGQGGRSFDCLKFRTMAPDAEARLPGLIDAEWRASRKFRHDVRVTRLGGFLRRSSIDELPQLMNVLRGEMSLVGPRPIVMDEAMLYGRRLADYCAARPGLTGLWQVSGRNDVPYRRRVAMDVWLVRNLTLGVYLAILARTVPAVLSRRGVY